MWDAYTELTSIQWILRTWRDAEGVRGCRFRPPAWPSQWHHRDCFWSAPDSTVYTLYKPLNEHFSSNPDKNRIE